MLEAGLWALVGADRMRALDAATIDDLGVPSEVLMESAGRAVVDHLVACFESRVAAGAPIEVVCGGGHNGGDGFVVVRHLRQLGWPARAHLVADRSKLGQLVRAQLARAEGVGAQVIDVPDGRVELSEMAIVVDALFGTGLARPLEGGMAECVERMNAARLAGSALLAVDLPSGIHSDTGAVLGVATAADETVTISLPKRGLALSPGREHAGRVTVARVGIADRLPSDGFAQEPDAGVVTRSGIARLLPGRPRAGHKGAFGHVLVVAGSEGKTGAAALAARGATRSGAGLVTIACPAGLNDVLEVKCTEAMTAPAGLPGARSWTIDALGRVLELAAERDVLALGPGLGSGDGARRLVHAVCERVEAPMVIDADGLNAIGRELGLLKGRRAATVLTPHPGEAARLLGCSARDVNADRIAAAIELSTGSECVVLLKGAGTVVADATGRVRVNPTGNPALGSGGTGDVLTGVVAALLAQGLAAVDAATAAAYLHGAAADAWAETHGEAGLAAEDLADAIPAAAARLRRLEAVGAAARASDERAGRTDLERPLLPFPFGR